MSVSSTRSRVAAWSALATYVAITALAVALVLAQDASAFSLGALAGLRRLRGRRRTDRAASAAQRGGLAAAGGRDHLRRDRRRRGLGRGRESGRRGGRRPDQLGHQRVVRARNRRPATAAPGQASVLAPLAGPVLCLAVLDLALSVASATIKPGPLELQQSSGIDNPLGVEGGLSKTLADVEVPIGAVALILAGAVGGRALPPLARPRAPAAQVVRARRRLRRCLPSRGVLFGTILADHRYNAIAVTAWLTGLALLGIGLPIATGFADLSPPALRRRRGHQPRTGLRRAHRHARRAPTSGWCC